MTQVKCFMKVKNISELLSSLYREFQDVLVASAHIAFFMIYKMLKGRCTLCMSRPYNYKYISCVLGVDGK